MQSNPAVPPSPRRRGLRRKLLYGAIILTPLILLAEVAARGVLRAYYGPSLSEAEQMHEYDTELGWVNVKDRRSLNRYGVDRHATHSAQRLRATRTYARAVPPRRYRVVCLGDSFTYGIVGDDETFPAMMEALGPGVETVNMGVPAYGIDQSYMWYLREGRNYDADLLLFAFVADDFRRMGMNAFMTRNPKPRLVTHGEDLRVTNVPVPTWGDASATGWWKEFPNRLGLVQMARKAANTWVGSYDPYPVAERVFLTLSEFSRQRGSRLVLAYLPTREELGLAGEAEAAARVAQFADREGLVFWNLTEAFRAAPEAERAALFQQDGHYTAAGNRWVAQELLRRMREQFPNFPQS